MPSPFFRFKHFTVWHDKCAMKVGTDGVLLGAWTPLPTDDISHIRVLDIGTGSGLIALMIAQRTAGSSAQIDAIDIDTDATIQAIHNFQISPWNNVLQAHQSTLQDWNSEPYHLIISNPPYFQNSLKAPDSQRSTARHTDTLTYPELIANAARLLAPNGILSLVLPIDAEPEILHLASIHNLYPTHITHVHSKPNKPAKRLLIALSPNNLITLSPNNLTTTTFYIESNDSPRSPEYKNITQDFYL